MKHSITSAQQWLHAHVNNSLSQQEYQQLSHKIETDESFAKEFALLLALHQALREEKHKELNKITAKPRLGRRHWLAIAASFLVISIFSWLLWPKHSLESILAKYQAAPPIYLVEKSDGQPDLQRLNQQAQQAFNAHDYQLATDYFKQILDNKTSKEIQFYQQQALRLSGQEVDMAILDELIAHPLYKQKATWEKTLILLSQGNIEKVKIPLGEISKEKENPYRKDAKAILKYLG